MASEYKASKKYVGVRKVQNAATWSYRFKVKVNGETLEGGDSGFETALEASEARARAIEDAKSRGYVANNSKLFSEVFEEWIDSQIGIKSPNTIKRHRSLYNNHLKHVFGDKYIISISGQDLDDFINGLGRPQVDCRYHRQTVYSAEYIDGFYKTLFAIFSFAKRNGYIKENRMYEVEKVKGRGTQRRKGQRIADDILSKIEERLRTTNLHPAFYIGLHTGLRISEIFALTWDDVDFENRKLNINKQLLYIEKCWTISPLKTPEAEREVLFNEDLYVYLHVLYEKRKSEQKEMGAVYRNNERVRAYTENNEELYLSELPFVNRKPNGELLTPDSGKIVQRICKTDLGYQFRWHDLRHTYATIAANELHVNINFLRQQLGHKKIESVIHYYTQVSPELENESRRIIQGIGVKPVMETYDVDFDYEQSGKRLENKSNYTFVNGKIKSR